MLWSASSLLLFCICYIHGIRADWWTTTSTLNEAIFTEVDPLIGCQPVSDPNLLHIEDCHSALQVIADNLREQQWELVRNAPKRELRSPSKPDGALDQGRFRLPAEISYGRCAILVNLRLGFYDENKTRIEPERPLLQLTTKQYFYFWEESVPHMTTEILTRCARTGNGGMARASVTIDSLWQLDFTVRILGISRLQAYNSIRLAWLDTIWSHAFVRQPTVLLSRPH
jgi:hypothetical protein